MNEMISKRFIPFDNVQSAEMFHDTHQLKNAFWLLALILFVWHLYAFIDKEVADVLGSMFISVAALLPAYLWCVGKSSGMPIFPLYALTFLWTYAYQLLGGHQKITAYDVDERFLASMTVTVFLLVGTAVWYRFAKTITRQPDVCLAMISGKGGDRFFIGVLFLSVFFAVATVAGWLAAIGGMYSIVRGTIMGLHALAVFVLFYRWGRRQLTRTATLVVLMLLVINVIANASSLLLIVPMMSCALAIIAFVLGRLQIPWKTMVMVVLCFSLLHAGKSEIRENHWRKGEQVSVQPWNYPALYSEWLGYSLKGLANPTDREADQSLLKRSSLLHVFLMAQRKTPDSIPYLYGATYAIIPELFIPRILNPDKITSNEGTTLLNIHYGLQTRADTRRTTLAWGMLNESYANFGIAGVLGLAICLGAVYGKLTSWSRDMPILSLRTFSALLFLVFAMQQTEATAGHTVSTLFQSMVVLGVVAFFLMQRQRLASSERLG